MPIEVPPPPPFGAPAPFGQVSAETLSLLATRRSASPKSLAAPGPSPEELQGLLRLAAHVPDHGKLAPWRFVVLAGDAKASFAERLEGLAAEQADPGKAAAVLFKLKIPPLAVAVISRPVEASIPLWEQQLSAGACCMTLVIAAQAMGYGANWITDWYGYDPRAGALLGLGSDERVAGFILIGTPTEAPMERVRPDVEAITTVWGAA